MLVAAEQTATMHPFPLMVEKHYITAMRSNALIVAACRTSFLESRKRSNFSRQKPGRLPLPRKADSLKTAENESLAQERFGFSAWLDLCFFARCGQKCLLFWLGLALAHGLSVVWVPPKSNLSFPSLSSNKEDDDRFLALPYHHQPPSSPRNTLVINPTTPFSFTSVTHRIDTLVLNPLVLEPLVVLVA